MLSRLEFSYTRSVYDGRRQNVLRERIYGLPVLMHFNLCEPHVDTGCSTANQTRQLRSMIAVFLLVRGPYFYLSSSNAYVDSSFVWHKEYEAHYGEPLGEPERAVLHPGTLRYSRNYSHCRVIVDCVDDTTPGVKALCDTSLLNTTAAADPPPL